MPSGSGNNDRHSNHSNHTGTIPKTKARNNCNVPQEAVTPTRRDMATNMVSTSLDWVPVSEYNSRGNCNQSRKRTNNTASDQELNDLDNSVAFESGFGRFVPVRPQPRALPLNVQNQNIGPDSNDDGAGSSASNHSLNPYAHQMQNGLMPHSNHAAAAVMIVNPTTPSAVAGSLSQPFNAPNQSRNNLTRNLNPARNTFEGNSHNISNHPAQNSRSTKTVNIMNNMYDQTQGSFNNINENSVNRESARALGEAIVAACPDAAAVERRLGQIREYIRVTSSLVDTMRNSEDEAYIEHTKEEYDELVEMVMKLKESETKLVSMLDPKAPDNVEVPGEETNDVVDTENVTESTSDEASDAKNTSDSTVVNNNLKKVTNLENEQLNKTIHVAKEDLNTSHEENAADKVNPDIEKTKHAENGVEIKELETIPCGDGNNQDRQLNEELKKNILSCVEKVARIEEMKSKNRDSQEEEQQDVVVRPVSVQSNGSAYSENEMWQNKMEMSQVRLNALKKQQKRLLQYQAEAKQQLEEMNREREREAQEIHSSTSHDNFIMMSGQSFGNFHPAAQTNRMFAANQVGVATTLPHGSEDSFARSQNSNIENDHATHSHEERFSHRDANVASSEEAAGGERDSEGEGEEEDEAVLTERARHLQLKIRELQLKKQHMENLVSEFHKLQMATRGGSSRNTYSSSGEDSGPEDSGRKFSDNKSGGNIKNEDPFKLMEIKAIKTALQKTKDLMRSVENYEEHLSPVPDESFQMGNHSNIHDNKSEGGGSAGGWSTEGSVCRVRNSLPPAPAATRHKFTNHQLQSNEANISALQDLAQELRRETEKIMGERALIKNMANKEAGCRQKKVNEEVVSGASGGGNGTAGPAERRQRELRALLAEKQRELEALLNKEKILCTTSPEMQNQKIESRTASVANQSYVSEQEEPDSRSEQIHMGSQNLHANDNFRGDADSTIARSVNTVSAHLGSAYGSDSDTASRNKNHRNRPRRRQPQDRQSDEINSPQQNNSNRDRHETRSESSNVNMVPPSAQSEIPANMPYPHLTPPNWNTSKSNQDMRNQFTQNSHSQTMERLLGTPQMSYPPSVPFNMMQMMPYGMAGGCGCGCGFWATWSWQQIALQQREIHQLREQLNHLEERWRAENASHTLNNQVPPGNRANNYWDNFRSYSRQNLLSASSKTNAEGGAGCGGGSHSPHPLAARSHNPLGGGAPPPAPPAQAPPPDVLHSTPRPAPSNLTSANLKKKSSSKLPAKNSRRNLSALDYSAPTNINIASTSGSPQPNPNLASAAGPNSEKATSKLFDLLRENVYSEVSTLIGVNESHPDFLIQLFRDLQLISSDPLRQRVLLSIRNVLSQYPGNSSTEENIDTAIEESRPEAVSTSNEAEYRDNNTQNLCSSTTLPMDNNILRFLLLKSDDTCTPEFLEALTSLILSKMDKPRSKKKILEMLSKFEGSRVCDVTGDILESLPAIMSVPPAPEEEGMGAGEGAVADLQDVAGSLNLFANNGCPYDEWPGQVEANDDQKDLEMQDGELAEADQARGGEATGGASAGGDTLPDLVDAEEPTPTEAEAGWLGLDRVPTRLHMEDTSEKQKD